MRGMDKGIMRPILCGIVFLFLLTTAGAGTPALAEQTLLVYPKEPTIFRYDPARYEVVPASGAGLNAQYTVAGVVLWDRLEDRVPLEVYRAPQLIGFEPSPYSMNEFVVRGVEFNIVVDGFCDSPRQLNNLYMRFLPLPSHSVLTLNLNGEYLTELFAPLPALVVSTPTGDGYYADTDNQHLRWSGATEMRITAYTDKNNDRVYNGDGPQFSILVTDGVVSTEETSWGLLKARYRGD